ncbi:MAG: EAL domain-containing protein [Burkholderiaceae bacterium]|nr:MAG: EAL domain-containing protein [Burkholderiaceae bacterium]
MSLIKQLWIGVLLIVLVAFGSSFVVSTLAAKRYLEQQLLLKNIDNATVLALSMSQMQKEPVAIELLLAAQFDAGHYQSITLAGPEGGVLAERQNQASIDAVPAWFMRMIPLRVAPGVAQVSDGWKQYGTLTVQSHPGFAYKSLWQETGWLLLACLLLAALSGALGAVILRVILRPLGRVVRQAEEMQMRRFITNPVPKTPELAALVRIMNHLSERVRAMLEDEAGRLEKLRREAHFDSLTGLLNREQLFSRIDATLSREDAAAAGTLVITRVLSLAAVNRTAGREAADALLVCLGNVLNGLIREHPDWHAGRLNGADLVLFAPGVNEVETLARQLHEAMKDAVAKMDTLKEVPLPTAATHYSSGETLSHVLSRVDVALLQAESSPYNPVQLCEETREHMPSDFQHWRVQIEQSLDAGRVMLAEFPVRDMSGGLLHVECPVRLQLEMNGAWLTAGQVIPWANKLGLTQKIDAVVVTHALDKLRRGSGDVGINLSARALIDDQFHVWLCERLKAAPALAPQLWLEFQEAHVVRHFPQFRKLSRALLDLGCKVGIEHAGHHVEHISALHDLGLHYVKVDGSIIRDIDSSLANQVFLRGICLIAHSIGMLALAEGVQSHAEAEMLTSLGVQGMTGPWVK